MIRLCKRKYNSDFDAAIKASTASTSSITSPPPPPPAQSSCKYGKLRRQTSSENASSIVSAKGNAAHVCQPMLSRPLKSYEQLRNVYDPHTHSAEIKYDGERLLYDTSTQVAYTRTLKRPIVSVEFHVVLHRRCQQDKDNDDDKCGALLDGERVYVDSKSGDIVPICMTGSRAKLTQRFVIFDILAIDGERITYKTLRERRCILENRVDLQSSRNVVLSTLLQQPLDAQRLIDKYEKLTRNNNEEGLIVKRLDEPYLSNKRLWWKMKPLHLRDRRIEVDLIAYNCLVDKNGEYRIIECGILVTDTNTIDDTLMRVRRVDDHVFVPQTTTTTTTTANTKYAVRYICRVSSGLSERDIATLNVLRMENIGLLKRLVVVSLSCDKITVGESLRHPIFLKFDFNKDVDSIVSVRDE
ncbi:DNA ligase [Phenacoccus solenopsis nudivirus]|nr:DNA ligase [Phenacoccus solenopsis nudivirus]